MNNPGFQSATFVSLVWILFDFKSCHLQRLTGNKIHFSGSGKVNFVQICDCNRFMFSLAIMLSSHHKMLVIVV